MDGFPFPLAVLAERIDGLIDCLPCPVGHRPRLCQRYLGKPAGCPDSVLLGILISASSFSDGLVSAMGFKDNREAQRHVRSEHARDCRPSSLVSLISRPPVASPRHQTVDQLPCSDQKCEAAVSVRCVLQHAVDQTGGDFVKCAFFPSIMHFA